MNRAADEQQLEDLRREIDRLDARLLDLLVERASRVRDAAAIKRRMGRPAIDGEREREIHDRLVALNAGRLPLADLESLLEALRRLMRRQTEFDPPGPDRPI